MKEPESSLTPQILEFYKFELQQSIEVFKTQFNLLVSIQTVFVVSNITVIGYAITHRISTIFLVGALIPLFMAFMIYAVGRFMVPVIYTALFLESKFERDDSDLIASTFARYSMKTVFVDEIYRISSLQSKQERTFRVNRLKYPFSFKSKFFLILCLLTAFQIVLAFILPLLPGWVLA